MYRQRLKIPWPEFGDSVRMALMDYAENVNDALTKEAQRAAKQTRADIQSNAPKRSGEYAKTWAVSKDASANKSRPAFVVHAKRPGYQLAHLLERSHKIRNQYGTYGVTNGDPHIEPAADKNAVTFTNNVVRIIKDLA